MSEVSTLPQGSEPVNHDQLAQIISDAGLATAEDTTALADRVTAVEANVVLENGGVTQDEIDAITGAATPSSSNVFATVADLPAGVVIGASEDWTGVVFKNADDESVGSLVSGADVGLSVYADGYDLVANDVGHTKYGEIVVDTTVGTMAITASDGVLLPGLPTADPLVADQLWNDGGAAKVSSGTAEQVFWEYDFDVDGGAQGTIPLRGAAIPINSFVNAAFVRVITPLTSDGSATVALTTGESAGDIDTVAAFDNAKYASGFHAVSVHKFTTASRTPAIVVAAADLTAGKIEILLDTLEGWS